MRRVGAFIYEQMTMLDVLGPHQLLGVHPEFELVTIAATTDPIKTDTGVTIVPDFSVHNAPDVDIVMTGGAADVSGPMSDPAVMDWFRKAGERAEYVTSVCSGSLILAEAGLLDGYSATTHWAYLPYFANYPQITPSPERVVHDRDRITAGGVTSGIDFALTLIAELHGPDAAAAVQLITEYDPAPPFNFGHPRNAPPELIAAVGEMLGPAAVPMDEFFAAKAQ
ncbi:MAG: DJ-1/PfpI family protein [Sporichthyaceae bacterium]